MAKGVMKKKNRKLMRQARKTAGALLLISSIVVAAIPVPKVSAADPAFDYDGRKLHETGQKVYILPSDTTSAITRPVFKSNVPMIADGAQIYADVIYGGDGNTKEATYYYAIAEGSAVILGAVTGTLPTENGRNYLQIPDEFITCQEYSVNGRFCAVNVNNQFLYYQKEEDQFTLQGYPSGARKVPRSQVVPEETDKDNIRYSKGTFTAEDGKPYTAILLKADIQPFFPCYREEFGDWKDKRLYIFDMSYNGDIGTTSLDFYGMDVDLYGLDDDQMSEPSPTIEPTASVSPSGTPTSDPSITPTQSPVAEPTLTPTTEPTPQPTMEPEPTPTQEPTQTPTAEPTPAPTEEPAPTSTSEVTEPEAAPAAVTDNELIEDTASYWLDKTVLAEPRIEVMPKTVISNKHADTTLDYTNVQKYRPVGGEAGLHPSYMTVPVGYIGQQFLVDKTGAAGEKKVGGKVTSANSSKGVFANTGNIQELRTGNNLVGIGDYAFYNCTSLQNIRVNEGVTNGLRTIGNGAFAYCMGLSECDLSQARNLQVIGMDTFLRCTQLGEFALPNTVEAIGDYCFMGCSGLKSITFNEDVFNFIGYDAFVDCSSLISVTFPEGYTEKIPITYFKGCTGMQSMIIKNTVCDLTETEENHALHDHPVNGKSCDIDEFIKALTYDGFYFEGPDNSAGCAIHETAKEHSISFKYVLDGRDHYEKIEMCPEETPHQITYDIMVGEGGDDQLYKIALDRSCTTIQIPSNIGGHHIYELGDGCLASYCYLENVTIPASVSHISGNAFQGCHRLNVVTFEHGENDPLQIDHNAFNTQDMGRGHQTAADGKACAELSAGFVSGDHRLALEPKLSFVGMISPSFGAFTYAMAGDNNINNNNQNRAYITYYSGWPTNLTVRYNPERPEGQENELINYPRYGMIKMTSTSGTGNVGYTTDEYPYLTPEMIKDAADAAGAGDSASGYYQSILDAGRKVYVPAGVTSIKPGLFSGLDADGKQATVDGTPTGQEIQVDEDIQSVTLDTVKEVEPYTFAGCPELDTFNHNDSRPEASDSIGDYAFKGCGKLKNVAICSGVSEIGIRPFAGCRDLTEINFVSSPHFKCDNRIVYGTAADGTKTSVVECLESRNGAVGADELAGITSLQQEAFKNCDDVRSIDLSEATVGDIPRQAFAQMDKLGIVTLSPNTTNVNEGAFWNTPDLYQVTIPNDRMQLAENALAMVEEDGEGEITLDSNGKPTVINDGRKDGSVNFVCSDGSVASNYAKNYPYIETTEVVQVRYYVTPQGIDNARPVLVDTVSVPVKILDDPEVWSEKKVDYEPDIGNASRYPEYQYPGYTFQGWDDYEKTDDGYRESYAHYAKVESLCTVNFVDIKNTAQRMVTITVAPGTKLTSEHIPEPADLVHFIEWEADESADVTIRDRIYEDVTFYATYSDVQATPTPTGDPGTSPSPTGGGNGGGSSNPSGGGNGGGSGSASPSASPNSGATATPSATPATSPEVKKYTVSVSGGSGSGQYPAGAIVTVNAYYMGEGQEFDKWTSSTAGVGFANPNASSTTFTMPAANVAVTATYKTGGSGTAATNTSGGSGSGSASTASNTNNGTVVEVDRPGISNENLAGATVSGATDNFVVKVTEDQAATDAATAALQARYGSLDRIKYLPMDISLYDSTGRTKIADTTGISVNLTLPLPDDLVQYAGNNRVAAIANGALEDLNTRFTTVDGVPCVNFTATHFSPYVIYVDTANLTEATIDATPKTGDPIHPKWFLSLGMACVALILFFKRDKAVVVRKKAA